MEASNLWSALAARFSNETAAATGATPEITVSQIQKRSDQIEYQFAVTRNPISPKERNTLKGNQIMQDRNNIITTMLLVLGSLALFPNSASSKSGT
jgi:hypothetical protein